MGKIYSKKCIKCMMNRKSTKYEYTRSCYVHNYEETGYCKRCKDCRMSENFNTKYSGRYNVKCQHKWKKYLCGMPLCF